MSGHGIDYRDYQISARDAAFSEFVGGSDSTLIVMPTGTGKTVLAGMCVEEALAHGKKTLFVAHREVLINQAFSTMGRFGFDVAVEMGRRSALARTTAIGQPDVVVGSIQSLQDDRLMRWPNDAFGLIVIDECHRSLADSYTKLLNWFHGYWLLGITATPSRGDRRNLGSRFASKAFEYPVREAIREEWIVPIRVRECRVKIDLRGIKMTGGDFSAGELEERINPKVEQIASAILAQTGERKTVVFTPDVGSALVMAQMISLIGSNDGTNREARYVAGEGGSFGQPRPERDANMKDFAEGKYQYIVCCELLIEGWDQPDVSAVAIARPTRQGYRYKQMAGRATRPCQAIGKTDCLILDFDWQCDEDIKDLCSSLDIFDDGQLDEDVFAVARQIAKERAVDIDPAAIIEEAEEIVRTRTRWMVRMTGKTSHYETVDYDPVGVAKLIGMKLNRKYDLDKRGDNPASAAQLGKLRSLGVDTPEGISKWGASKLIDKVLKRQTQGLAGLREVKELLTAGVDADVARAMSSADATGAIEALRKTRPAQSQGSLFQ